MSKQFYKQSIHMVLLIYLWENLWKHLYCFTRVISVIIYLCFWLWHTGCGREFMIVLRYTKWLFTVCFANAPCKKSSSKRYCFAITVDGSWGVQKLGDLEGIICERPLKFLNMLSKGVPFIVLNGNCIISFCLPIYLNKNDLIFLQNICFLSQ